MAMLKYLGMINKIIFYVIILHGFSYAQVWEKGFYDDAVLYEHARLFQLKDHEKYLLKQETINV